MPTYLISHPSAVCGRWKQCFEVLSKQQKPGHGESWRDNEMIAANGTVISAGMSGVRADLCSHTTRSTAHKIARVKVFDLSLPDISFKNGP